MCPGTSPVTCVTTARLPPVLSRRNSRKTALQPSLPSETHLNILPFFIRTPQATSSHRQGLVLGLRGAHSPAERAVSLGAVLKAHFTALNIKMCNGTKMVSSSKLRLFCSCNLAEINEFICVRWRLAHMFPCDAAAPAGSPAPTQVPLLLPAQP